MTSFNPPSIILCLFMITICHGFEFSIERREYLVETQAYCGLLQCQVDTVSDTNMASLIKMDIYYLKDEHLLATMLAVNSEIKAQTGNNTIVIGSMSKDHGEFHVYFSDPSNCSETAFICKIHYQNKTNGKEIAEKVILPIYSDQSEADVYIKSQISIEHKIFDKSGRVMKKLKGLTSLTNEGSEFYLTLANPYLINTDEISTQRKKTRTVLWGTEENNFERTLSDLELKLRTQLELFMNQMSSKMEDIKYATKEISTNINDLTHKDINGKSNQAIAALIQSQIDSKLSNLERRMDDIFETFDKVNVIANDSKHLKCTPNEVNSTFDELIKQEMIRAYEKSMSLLIKNQVDQKLSNLTTQIGDVIVKVDQVNISLNDLNTSVSDNDKRHDLRNNTDQSFSAVLENLKELTLNQRTLEALLVNVTTNFQGINQAPDKCNSSEDNDSQVQLLKCEKGMSSSRGSRVITLLDNKTQVLCDTETDGGGWIIIQRRINGQVNFTRNWHDYKWGFGSLDGDFWFGNELISSITSKSKEIYTLRIDVRQGSNAYSVEYDSFMVKNESDKYRLHLGVFKGNTWDSLSWHNNMAFSTPDRDNDVDGGNCAQFYKSGWWYRNCHTSHLNGVWGLKDGAGLRWTNYPATTILYLDFVEMKIRLK